MNELLLQVNSLSEGTVFDCDIPRRGMLGVTGCGGSAAFLKLLAKRERYMGVFHYYFNGAPVYVRGGSFRRTVKALTSAAELFLLDEPLAGMTAWESREILKLIGERNDDGATFVVAAANLSEFGSMLTAVMDAGAGTARCKDQGENRKNACTFSCAATV